eukprot:5330966-Alexandrium_andersonii.AAC.1
MCYDARVAQLLLNHWQERVSFAIRAMGTLFVSALDCFLSSSTLRTKVLGGSGWTSSQGAPNSRQQTD